MPTGPRRDKMNPAEIETHHVWSRCVARAFLFGVDPLTGDDFSYRMQWLESLTEYQASVFAVEVGNYHWMSNHIHGVLRNRPDIAATWGKEEICWRWKMAWPSYKNGRWLREPTDKEIKKLLIRCDNEPEYLDFMRRALGDISWFMARLKEPIAKMANAETGRRGHFWEQRYGNHHLETEGEVVASFVYNDLQKVVAGMVGTVEESTHAGIARQLKALAEGAFEDVFGRPPETEEDCREVESLTQMFSNCFLAPITDRGPLLNQRDVQPPPTELILPAGYHANVATTSDPRRLNLDDLVTGGTDGEGSGTEEDDIEYRAAGEITTERTAKEDDDTEQSLEEYQGESPQGTAQQVAERPAGENNGEVEQTEADASPQTAASSSKPTRLSQGKKTAAKNGAADTWEIHKRYRRRQRRRASRNSMLCMPWEAYFAILKVAEANLLRKRDQGFTRAPPEDSPPGVALPSETTASWRTQLRDFTTSLQAWAAQMPRELAAWVVGRPRGDPEPTDGLES